MGAAALAFIVLSYNIEAKDTLGNVIPPPSYFDWFYILNVFLIRSMIVGVKYGYFSKEQMFIY